MSDEEFLGTDEDSTEEVVEEDNTMAEVLELARVSGLDVKDYESAFDMNTMGQMLVQILVQTTELVQWKREFEQEIEKFMTEMNSGGMLTAVMRMFRSQ